MKFTIQADIPDRWVDTFCSMLKKMEWDGNVGHSEKVSLYADGDGDFRPKFNFSCKWYRVEPVNEDAEENETFYDAG